MKFIHIADCHLGANPLGTRSEDFYRAWFWFLGIAANRLNPGDVVIMAGDIFDSPALLPREVEVFELGMDRLVTRLGLKVVLIEGNHDTSSRKELLSRLDPNYGGNWPQHFQGKYGPESVIAEEIDSATSLPRVYIVGEGDDRISICPINYRAKPVIRDLVARLPEDYATVLVMHQSVEGAIPRIGDPDLTPANLNGRATYVALGDLHVQWSEGVIRGESQTKDTLIAYPGPLEWSRSSEVSEPGLVCGEFEGGRLMTFGRMSNPTSRRYIPLYTSERMADVAEAFRDNGIEISDIERVPLGLGTMLWGAVANLPSFGLTYLDVKYPHTPDESAKLFANEVFDAVVLRFPRGSCIGKVSKLPSVDRSFDFVETENASPIGTVTMQDAIREMYDPEEPLVTTTAITIWEHPADIYQIIDHVTDFIGKKLLST